MGNRKVLYDLSKHTVASVGRKKLAQITEEGVNAKEEENPLVLVSGFGIQEKHAQFITDDEKTTIKPLCDDAMS